MLIKAKGSPVELKDPVAPNIRTLIIMANMLYITVKS
jgi:hypothetical protein